MLKELVLAQKKIIELVGENSRLKDESLKKAPPAKAKKSS